jgi:hypothetical protein
MSDRMLRWNGAVLRPSPLAQRLFCIFIVIVSVVSVGLAESKASCALDTSAGTPFSGRVFSARGLPRTSSGAELDRASGTGLRRLVAAHSFL